jgi:hypothetical protein
MRLRIVLGLAVLVILAGCQGAPDPGTGATPSPAGESPDATTGAVDTVTGTPNTSTFSYPPGATAEELDPTVLPDQHSRALVESQLYTVTHFRTIGNRTIRTRMHVDQGGQRMVGRQRVVGSDGAVEDGSRNSGDLYATAETIYQRQRGHQLTNGSALVNYDRRAQNWSTRALTARSTLEGVLDAYRFQAVGVTGQNGTPSVRYRAESPRGETGSGSALAANASVRLTVDDRGIVRSLRVRRDEGATVGFRITNVSTAVVTTPEWVADVPGGRSLETPNATLSATSRTIELQTANATLETTAVSISHDGGDPIEAAALDVTVARKRAYDVRERSTSNDSLVPVPPFHDVGETFDPGESVRVVHTVPPRLYGGVVTIDDGSIAAGDRSGNRTFPSLEDRRSIEPGTDVRVLWNRSRPQTLLTYRVERPGSNRTVNTAS